MLNQTDMIFLTGLKSLLSQESTTVSSKVTAFLFALEQTRLVAIRDRHDPIPPPQKQKQKRADREVPMCYINAHLSATLLGIPVELLVNTNV